MGQQGVASIEHHAAWTRDRPALADLHRGCTLSYGELAARMRSVVWSLARDRRGRQAPVRVIAVTELPCNATGKVLNGPLRDAARDSA